MFRLHLTDEDLRKITVGRFPDVMLELALSMVLVQRPSPGPALDAWHSWGRSRLPAQARPALALTPPPGLVPDFLVPPVHPGDGIDEGMERLLRTPREQLRDEMTALASNAAMPRWARDLAAGEPSVMRGVVRSIRDYHQAVLAPLEAHIRQQVGLTADRVLQTMAVGGLDAMLDSLHPGLRWRPPYIEGEWDNVGPDVVDSEFDVGGRGLRMQPSFFSYPDFVYGDVGASCVLSFPVTDHGTWSPPPALPRRPTPTAERALAGLLGATRAATLRTLTTHGQQTTSGLAELTGISPPTVSHHTTALRAAGLITTRRTGTSVHHAATRLGIELVQHSG